MASQSSQGSSQPTQSQGRLPSHEDLQTLVNETVVFILSQDNNKHPIRRADIVKNCLNEFGKAFKLVMDEVKLIMKKVYGMDLVEIESSTNKQYMLINSLKMSNHLEELVPSEESQAQHILLFLVLSHIFMKGGVVNEDDMWSHLTQLDVIGQSKIHPYFGDVRKFMTLEFVRQMYIEHSRIPDSDPPKFTFRWGHRAQAEISHFEILNCVTKLHGNDDMKMWTSQYKDMVRAENKRRHNDMIESDDADVEK